MATSISLHFCKLLRSSLNICLEFDPPRTNQEFYMKALFYSLNLLAQIVEYTTKSPPPPLFYLSKMLKGIV